MYNRRSPRYHAVFPAPSRELFSATSLKQITATSWRTTLPLCSQLPYSVDWQVALDRIIIIGSGAEDVVPAELGCVVNGALVCLVSGWEDGDAVITNQVIVCTDALRSGRSTAYSYFFDVF